MILTRLTSLLLLMVLMSTVLGAWIGTNGEDDEEDWTEKTGNAEEPLDDKDDLKIPRQHKIPLMTKIIGGRDAVRGETPWQARIALVWNDSSIEHICGAVIINEDWLLTAAHCFIKIPFGVIRIYVGDYSLSQKDAGEQMFELDDVIIHEKYFLKPDDSDIALLKIHPTYDGRRIQFSKYVQPIKLPDSTTYVSDGTPCLISGWGYYRYGLPQAANILRAANVPIISHQTCERYFTHAINDNQICAGDLNRGITAYHLDSGGPLVCKTGDVNTLIGIVNSGPDCEHFKWNCFYGRIPGVFASVAAHRNWITSKIGL